MIRSADIRRQFLDFFIARGHRAVPSSPIVPKDDPTLLFTSAGMVQFKALYVATGRLEYTRATSVQKCFRVTDLEQVGLTPRHCTFFEMLGNFSFGDYFKREAIGWAWEFCVDVLKMNPDRLWASVYLDDDEAASIWRTEIGLPAGRIVRLGKKDNFWGPAGATGACGPCSEIYYDLGPEFGPETACPGDEYDRYQEFWNLVFPQFFQDEQGKLNPLAKPGIDTGMGLERLTQILNGYASVFETDAFRPLIEAAADMAGVDPDDESARVSLRIVAEHARALTVAVSEGIYPGNEGRGYVVRRLLRRAARRGQILGLKDPFLYRLSGLVTDLLGGHYTEMNASRDRVATIIKSEEERFDATVRQGMDKFEEISGRLSARGESQLSGVDAFVLYDTYGFPLDLTREMASERGLTVDENGFSGEMARQVERSRAASRFEGVKGATDRPWHYVTSEGEAAPHSKFIGYEAIEADARIVAWREAEGGDDIEFLLDQTPFYAESGGQVTDTGLLRSAGSEGGKGSEGGAGSEGGKGGAGGEGGKGCAGSEIQVEHVKRNDKGEIVHRGKLLAGRISEGPWQASIPAETRRATERNHTATHLLHAALRKVLGPHVVQAGSLVAADRLRFDFAHFAPITESQKEEIETIVNREILLDRPIETEWDSLESARSKGAMALFGEKYSDWVRQVIVPGFSRELCGGTHVRRTGEIGTFRILTDESVASGTRRIEAATGWRTVRLLRDDEVTLGRVAELVRAPRAEIEPRVRALLEENERMRREIEKQKAATLGEKAGALADQVQEIAGIRYVASEVPAESMDQLREAADRVRQVLKSGVAVLGARFDGKATFLALVTEDLVTAGKLRADVLVREVAKIAGGSGGGKPNLATAGAKQPEKMSEALARVPEILKTQIG